MASLPDCEPVFVTRKALDAWRQRHDAPRARLGIYFGLRTSIWFLDGIEPTSFEFFPMRGIGDGYILLERATIARRQYAELFPDADGIF